jgi:predicted short-subunit dehydrogenase-like oxidoreductase (DUF2520 family)
VLGAGHVATHLALALAAAGHRIVGVWSRLASHAEALANRLPGAPLCLKSLAEAAALVPDVVLVAVPDHAVQAVIAAAALPASVIVAHTAGTLPLPLHQRAGVFYPLQTFSAARVLDLNDVPFCLEASDDATAAVLDVLARSISQRPPLWLTAAERAPLHLAAVFAANFPNHLLGVSQQILTAAGGLVPFAVLRPLVEEVISKAFAAPNGPFSVQTGPAARGDAATLAAHRARLLANPALAASVLLYEVLTDAIQQRAVAAAERPTLPNLPV